MLNKLISIPKKFTLWFLKASLKKKIITIIIALILVSIISRAIFAERDSGYTIEKVSRTTITETVSETGNVNTGAVISTTSPTTGIIEEVYAENGQFVNEGDLLFKVKSSATEQEQQTAYANYLAAVASLNAARSNLNTLRAGMYAEWESFRNLATSDKYEIEEEIPDEQARIDNAEFQIAQDRWLAAEKQYKDQQTAVGQASAQVSATWLIYQATQNAEVKATAAGTVANLSIAPGGSIIAHEKSALAIVTSYNDIFIQASVNEIDIPKINPSQKVNVRIDAVQNRRFEGLVDRVDNIGTNVQGVISYNVYVKLLDSDSQIRNGMTANIEIITETAENALAVPNSAVRPYQGGRAVQILNDRNEPEYIPVITGIRGITHTQIIEGLDEGQEIIVGASGNQSQGSSPFGF